MAPTVVALGAVATGTTTMTPALPAGIAANDIILIVAETVGGQSINLPTSWAHITSGASNVSPVVQSTNTQLTVFWRRYDGAFTAPLLSGPVDHCIGRTIAIRGCPTTGNPWNVVAVATEALSDTSVTWPGATTTAPDTLVLEILALSADIGSGQIAAMTNAAYTSITEQMDDGTLTGNGGVIICYSGIKTTAGATGSSTATVTTAGFKSLMTLAMISAVAAAAAMPRPRPRSANFRR